MSLRKKKFSKNYYFPHFWVQVAARACKINPTIKHDPILNIIVSQQIMHGCPAVHCISIPFYRVSLIDRTF